MRTVKVPFLDREVSALGFGCASLGSRIAPATGRAAIERALEAGITWFDVAPSYGDGQAETLLGAALGGRAGEVAVVTKAGIVANPPGRAQRAVARVVRPIVARVPSMRALVKRLRPGTAKRAVLTGLSVRESLYRSLDRLKLDRVAVFALHEPTLAEVVDADVRAALWAIKEEGLAGAIGIAGEVWAFTAGRAVGGPYDVLQTDGSLFSPVDLRLSEIQDSLRPTMLVTHSVFGVGGALDRALAMSELRDRHPPGDIPRVLLSAAFDANPKGVVLTSAYTPDHLAMNVAAANETPDAARLAALRALLRGHGFGQRPPGAGDMPGKPEPKAHGEERRVRLA